MTASHSTNCGRRLSLALIGCGAISEAFHLPALREHSERVERLVLVDPDGQRARGLASQFPNSEVAGHHAGVLPDVDGAIVASPPHTHHSIAIACVEHGVPVLCEKPLSESAAKARELVSAAHDHGVEVAVNNTRRLYPANRRIKEMLAGGILGNVRRLEFAEGERFEWPAVSDFYFGPESDGRGVLLDKGAHVLDLACWWLGEKPRVVSFRDDYMGGTEAMCRLDFEADECSGTVVLSWLRKLENTFRVSGEQGTVETTVFGWDSITHRDERGRERTVRPSGERHVKADFASMLIENFLDVAGGEAEPFVPAASVQHSIELIEDCYEARERFDMPWFAPQSRLRVGHGGRHD